MGSNEKTGKKTLPFGKYVLVKRLRKSGGLFNSFAAVHRETKDKVEIRILKNPTPERSPLTKRFIHELQLLAKVKHPSVIPVYNAGYKEGRLYFTTLLRKSVRLDKYLKSKGGKLTVDETIRFAKTLVSAISAMHKQKIIHRSLSTTVIYVDVKKDVPFIGECETAKDMRIKSLTANGFPPLAESVPTPESFSGAELDERTDVFHLCAIVYRLVTGQHPFPDDQYARYFRRETPKPVASISSVLGANVVPESFEKAILKGLSISPDERHSSADALAKDFAKAQTPLRSEAPSLDKVSSPVRSLIEMLEVDDQTAIPRAFSLASELPAEKYEEFLDLAAKHEDTAIRFAAKKARKGELTVSTFDKAAKFKKEEEEPKQQPLKEKKQAPKRPKAAKAQKVAKEPRAIQTPDFSLFSPNSVALATFFGWPVGGSLLLAVNYWRLSSLMTASLVLALGVIGTFLQIFLQVVIPFNIHYIAGLAIALVMNVLAAFIMRTLVEKLQGDNFQAHLRAGGQEHSQLLSGFLGCLSIGAVLGSMFLWVLVSMFVFKFSTGQIVPKRPTRRPTRKQPTVLPSRPTKPITKPTKSPRQTSKPKPTKKPQAQATATRFGKRLVFGPTGRCEVYFEKSVEQTTAQRLGDVLVQLRFFGDKNTSSVLVKKDKERYAVYFLVKEHSLKQSRTESYFRLIGLQLAAVAFRGKGLQIRLATEPFKARTTITISATKSKNYGPNIFFYSSDVSEEEATALFNALQNIHVFQKASSHTVLAEADVDGFTLSFCLKEGMWTKKPVVKTFANIANKLSSPTFVGQPVKIKLCNSLMETQLSVP